MRFHRETQNAKRKTQNELDEAGRKSKRITETLLKKFPKKQWVIDAGSLQVMEAKHIPQNAILTPNKREFEILFGEELGGESICCSGPKMAPRQTQSACSQITQKHRCIIVLKNIDTFVCSPKECMVIKGGSRLGRRLSC
jgi:NAD(P)H-hydrate repair Nnr-like enzyme with NAD(P)H-hydrate dehydratase domain